MRVLLTDFSGFICFEMHKPQVGKVKRISWDSLFGRASISPKPQQACRVGNNSPVELVDDTATIKKALSKEAIEEDVMLHLSHAPETYAAVLILVGQFENKLATNLQHHVTNLVTWCLGCVKGCLRP
jgi:hypothetical protein